MNATKMVLPIPDHVRAARGIKNLHWYVICGGEWNNAHVYVDDLPVGADIVLLTSNNEVVRWAFASCAAAHQALTRWCGCGAPYDPKVIEFTGELS